MAYLVPIMTLGVLGLVFGIGLAYALKLFAVQEDPRVEQARALLPGTNCGGCGYLGCAAYAEALVKGQTANAGLCKPGGEQSATALAALLGLTFTPLDRTVAVVQCGADRGQRTVRAQYQGYRTCGAAQMIAQAGMACGYGCIGYGDCERVCPFGAITVINGRARIDPYRCTACGKCVGACPRGIIRLQRIPAGGLFDVLCSSHDTAKATRESCTLGCIACRICEKLSGGAFTVADNLASLDTARACPQETYRQAVEKCPRKIIAEVCARVDGA